MTSTAASTSYHFFEIGGKLRWEMYVKLKKPLIYRVSAHYIHDARLDFKYIDEEIWRVNENQVLITIKNSYIKVLFDR